MFTRKLLLLAMVFVVAACSTKDDAMMEEDVTITQRETHFRWAPQ